MLAVGMMDNEQLHDKDAGDKDAVQFHKGQSGMMVTQSMGMLYAKLVRDMSP